MSSNTTRDFPRQAWPLPGGPGPRPLSGIDPVVLGQAGLQALALAGTAILARYAQVEEGADGMSELAARLPHPDRGILLRALGAFAEPAPEGDDGSRSPEPSDPMRDQRRADALVAMCLRARTVLARERRAGSSMVMTGVPRGERASG